MFDAADPVTPTAVEKEEKLISGDINTSLSRLVDHLNMATGSIVSSNTTCVLSNVFYG